MAAPLNFNPYCVVTSSMPLEVLVEITKCNSNVCAGCDGFRVIVPLFCGDVVPSFIW